MTTFCNRVTLLLGGVGVWMGGYFDIYIICMLCMYTRQAYIICDGNSHNVKIIIFDTLIICLIIAVFWYKQFNIQHLEVLNKYIKICFQPIISNWFKWEPLYQHHPHSPLSKKKIVQYLLLKLILKHCNLWNKMYSQSY